MTLKDKVRQLERNNYEESDSDEHQRWERQKKANRRKNRHYRRACRDDPAIFHELK